MQTDRRAVDLWASWNAYTRAFGDAMVLLCHQANKPEVLSELRRARDALNDVLDHLPAEGLNANADISRRSAEMLRENVDAIVQEVSATRQ